MNTDIQALLASPEHHLLMELLPTATLKAGNGNLCPRQCIGASWSRWVSKSRDVLRACRGSCSQEGRDVVSKGTKILPFSPCFSGELRAFVPSRSPC